MISYFLTLVDCNWIQQLYVAPARMYRGTHLQLYSSSASFLSSLRSLWPMHCRCTFNACAAEHPGHVRSLYERRYVRVGHARCTACLVVLLRTICMRRLLFISALRAACIWSVLTSLWISARCVPNHSGQCHARTATSSCGCPLPIGMAWHHALLQKKKKTGRAVHASTA